MTPKFRAWDKLNKMFVRIDGVSFATDGSIIKVDTELFDFSEFYEEDNSEPFHNVVLMQYTGLKDKNGVEVYINDIVEDEYGYRYEIVFEGDCLRCNGVRRVRGGYKPKNRWFSKDLGIIGNVYEDKELLEEEE